MKVFLVTYRALALTARGRRAAAAHDLPLFADASCRREPDLESPFPTITGLCRLDKLVTRISEGDILVYLTKKAYFSELRLHCWRLTAILQAQRLFSSHDEMADWFLSANLPLPSNCMVRGNPPLPLDKTDRLHESVELWDRIYQTRARSCTRTVACKPIYRELVKPPIINDNEMHRIFGRIPGTQTPPVITADEYEMLLEHGAIVGRAAMDARHYCRRIRDAAGARDPPARLNRLAQLHRCESFGRGDQRQTGRALKSESRSASPALDDKRASMGPRSADRGTLLHRL